MIQLDYINDPQGLLGAKVLGAFNRLDQKRDDMTWILFDNGMALRVGPATEVVLPERVKVVVNSELNQAKDLVEFVSGYLPENWKGDSE